MNLISFYRNKKIYFKVASSSRISDESQNIKRANECEQDAINCKAEEASRLKLEHFKFNKNSNSNASSNKLQNPKLMNKPNKKRPMLAIHNKNLELASTAGLEVIGSEATLTSMSRKPALSQGTRNQKANEIENSTSASTVSSKMSYLKRYIANGLSSNLAKSKLKFSESSWNRLGTVAVSLKFTSHTADIVSGLPIDKVTKSEKNDFVSTQQQQQENLGISKKSYFTYNSMKAFSTKKNDHPSNIKIDSNQFESLMTQPLQHPEPSVVDSGLKVKGNATYARHHNHHQQQQKQQEQAQQQSTILLISASKTSNSSNSRRAKIISSNGSNEITKQDDSDLQKQFNKPSTMPAEVGNSINSPLNINSKGIISNSYVNLESINPNSLTKYKNYHKYAMIQQNKKQVVPNLINNNLHHNKAKVNFSSKPGLNNSLLIKRLKY
jgi:hypothetical protein